MRDILGESLKSLKRLRLQKNRLYAIVLVLSAIVSLNVFWGLRRPGLTLAGDAACGIQEHTHGDGCFALLLNCELPEEAHIHAEGCYTTQFIEAQEQLTLVCTQTEDPHNHTDGCYTTQLTEASEFLRLVCTEEEEFHAHVDECYELVIEEPIEETVLICTLQSEPHEHTESCYALEVIEACEMQVLTCGLSETAHSHEASCYTQELHCQLQEHVHVIECYSDESADVETQLDWQNMFAGYPYSGDLRRDLVGIAKTQVGYSESTRNFEIGSDGVRRGYTRYGAWYGTPYRDWSAAFVSFCLNYAGADPNQTPGNIGANTMAALWQNQGRFTPPGDYIPSAGDIVFFHNNTVAVVSEVHSTTFYLIRGDMDNAVGTASLMLNDPSIAGWGLTVIAPQEPALDPSEETASDPTEETVSDPTEETVPDSAEETVPDSTEETVPGSTEETVPDSTEETVPDSTEETVPDSTEETVPDSTEETIPDSTEETIPDSTDETISDSEEDSVESPASQVTWEELLDISNGPVFFVFADSASMQQTQAYAVRSPRSSDSLLTYLADNNGTLSIKLLNEDDTSIYPDANGNYTVDPNVGYKLHLRVESPNGIPPGSYFYQLPQGVTVAGGNGPLTVEAPGGEKLDVGTWELTDDGLIVLNFNYTMVNLSGISIPATMGVQFSYQELPINFDGRITVTVNPPPDMEDPTVLEKWGSQGYEGNKEGKTDSSKIYWSVKISGHNDSMIPGSVLTDNIVNGEWYGTHRYTQSDMEAGLRIDATGPDGKWHSWTVHQGDPGLQWTETGWAYTIPETVICQDGEELTLGNDGWEYVVNYTTTPDASDVAGFLTYSNKVTIEDLEFDGYVRFRHGNVQGQINKTGNFQADAGGGSFHWEITADIPGYQQGQKANFWYLVDSMNLYDAGGNSLGVVTNDADKAIVTATNNGITVQVPNLSQATPDNAFAWYVSWSSNTNGIDSGRTITLLHRCDCTAENCVWWGDGGCGSFPWIGNTQDEHFCQCWTVEGLTTITLTYNTTDLSIVENYGGVGNQLANYVSLNYVVDGNVNSPFFVDDGWVSVTVPGMFKKELTQDFNGYTAHYQITVNEAKLALTNGSALQVHDEMTETLVFINGSLAVRTEDANGTLATLQQGEDYTIEYDGTGNTLDVNGNKVHVLDITILHPQPVKYIIDYDATLIPPEGGSVDVTYSNSATITLWGKSFTEETPEKTYMKFGITGESYKVELRKNDSITGDPLYGAIFGLYTAQHGQIATGETSKEQNLTFITDIIQGIIFRQHELYYLKELQAPAGYQLDDTPHWFYFCNSQNAETCENCGTIPAEYQATRIPQDQIRVITVTNDPISYNLPSTGGSGVYPLVLVSVMLIMTPLVYTSVQRRKRERRPRD